MTRVSLWDPVSSTSGTRAARYSPTIVRSEVSSSPILAVSEPATAAAWVSIAAAYSSRNAPPDSDAAVPDASAAARARARNASACPSRPDRSVSAVSAATCMCR